MKKLILSLVLSTALLSSWSISASAEEANQARAELSLITKTPEEGFQLAVSLARKGVSTIQKDKEVLHEQREVYSHEASALIAASQVVAIHFQTIAAANDYWRDKK